MLWILLSSGVDFLKYMPRSHCFIIGSCMVVGCCWVAARCCETITTRSCDIVFTTLLELAPDRKMYESLKQSFGSIPNKKQTWRDRATNPWPKTTRARREGNPFHSTLRLLRQHFIDDALAGVRETVKHYKAMLQVISKTRIRGNMFSLCFWK